MKLKKQLTAAAWLLLSATTPALAQDSGVWTPYLGQNLKTPALPDWYANYFSYAFDRTVGQQSKVGLRITGDYAYARYMSFNVYDGKKGTTLGAVSDTEIAPRRGQVNPFVAGSDAQAKNRKYTVTVVPEDSQYVQRADETVLRFPAADVHNLVVMIRYYVAQGNDYGNVPLPKIEAFDVQTGKPVALPNPPENKPVPLPVYRLRLLPFLKANIDDQLRFYYNPGEGQFNNADNLYLVNAVDLTPDEVLTLRIFPPTYPAKGSPAGKTEVRFWSLTQGNADTTTPLGMMDAEFKASSDGYVYVTIGDDSIRQRAEQLGYNFMPWRVKTRQGVLIYRNMLTRADFPGLITKVPPIDPAQLDEKSLHALDAKHHIGRYAPTGQKITKTAFARGRPLISPPTSK